jgi:uncharacterized protein YukE
MTSFTVKTPVLAAAAITIETTAATVGNARSAASSAAGAAGAFGGESIGGAFTSMCSRAQQATEELETVMHSLSRNVASAAVGYLVTDQGIVPTNAMPGFKA